jgi:hypothetical protein
MHRAVLNGSPRSHGVTEGGTESFNVPANVLERLHSTAQELRASSVCFVVKSSQQNLG